VRIAAGRAHRIDGRSLFVTRPLQSLVETIIILPVIAVVLIGTMEAGRLLYAAIAVQEAAQAGALAAAQVAMSGEGCAGCRMREVCDTIVRSAIMPNGKRLAIDRDRDIWFTTQSPGIRKSATCATPVTLDSWTPGAPLTITVTHRYAFITPLPTRLKTVDLRATMTGGKAW